MWYRVGAQCVHIAPAMLSELCQYVILGHSERRAAGGHLEKDVAIHRKVKAALEATLTPILCVGENLKQNEAGETHEFVSGQVRAALDGQGPDEVGRCGIASEPMWAIGTGKAGTP